MRVLLTGAGGQLGRELQLRRPEEISLRALTRSQLDITDRQGVEREVDRFRPLIEAEPGQFNWMWYIIRHLETDPQIGGIRGNST